MSLYVLVLTFIRDINFIIFIDVKHLIVGVSLSKEYIPNLEKKLE